MRNAGRGHVGAGSARPMVFTAVFNLYAVKYNGQTRRSAPTTKLNPFIVVRSSFIAPRSSFPVTR